MYTNNSYMCSQHFVGLAGPSKENPLPSIFPQKTFKTSVNILHVFIVFYFYFDKYVNLCVGGGGGTEFSLKSRLEIQL